MASTLVTDIRQVVYNAAEQASPRISGTLQIMVTQYLLSRTERLGNIHLVLTTPASRLPALAFCAILACSVLAAARSYGQTSTRQGAGGAVPTPSTSPYQMLSAVAGSKGVQRNGRLYFQDPRTVFRLGHDHRIMVEFEWNGPIGPHNFAGMWKNPNGQVVVVTNFRFAPVTSPFSGYFTMLVSDTAPTGIWTIDATIDGQTAGTYSFEIVSASSELPEPRPAQRIPLTPQNIYSETRAATVFVDKLNSAGERIGRGSGFFVAPSRLVTAFENIDGAAGLRIVFPNGQMAPANQVLAWNRWEDWAMLKVNWLGPHQAVLKLARAKSWNVGDRCYSLGVSAGGRTILGSNIIGDTNEPPLGERLMLSIAPGPKSIGSPVVNQFGDVIGVLSGSLLPSFGSVIATPVPGAPNSAIPSNGLVVPIGAVSRPPADQSGSSLADLTARGVFMRPVQARDQVGYAALARHIDRKEGPAWPSDTGNEFSLSEQDMVVFINWETKTKYKGVTTVHFFDLGNKEISQTRPMKLKIRPGHIESSYWTIPLKSFSPGIYRVDIDLGGAPAWREFFRITP